MQYDQHTLELAPECAMCYVDAIKPVWQNAENTCHLFKFSTGEYIDYTFAGTEDIEEWLVDFYAVQEDVHDHPDFGPVHKGLWDNTKDAIQFMLSDVQGQGWPKVRCGGHSKGGGNARLAAAAFRSLGRPFAALRLFEPPMVGTKALSFLLTDTDVAWTQSYNASGKDVVTEVPFWGEFEQSGVLISLQVPDDADVATKHKIPALLTSLGLPPIAGD